MPMGANGILSSNLNIQNGAHTPKGLSASMLKGSHGDENAACRAFDDGNYEKQLMMMSSECHTMEEAMTKLNLALNIARVAT